MQCSVLDGNFLNNNNNSGGEGGVDPSDHRTKSGEGGGGGEDKVVLPGAVKRSGATAGMRARKGRSQKSICSEGRSGIELPGGRGAAHKSPGPDPLDVRSAGVGGA